MHRTTSRRLAGTLAVAAVLVAACAGDADDDAVVTSSEPAVDDQSATAEPTGSAPPVTEATPSTTEAEDVTASSAPDTEAAENPDAPDDAREAVVDLLNSIESGDPAPAAIIDPENYTQHNLSIADGIEGFGAVLAELPEGSARVDVVRAFQDGAFVFTHTDYDFFGPKIGFDVFRFEDGLIVEHWDNLQVTPDSPNPSGRTMVDGPTEATDLDRTEENKALVSRFVDEVLVGGDVEILGDFFDGDEYIQHNPNIADGVSGLVTALTEFAEQGMAIVYDEVHFVLGEGNFVLAASSGTIGVTPTAFYDLFRVEDGVIAEHWDVIETIPPEGEWANDNGKF